MRNAARAATRRPPILVLAGLALLALVGGIAEPAAAQPVRPVQLTGTDGFFELGIRNETEDRSRQRGGSVDRIERLELSEIFNLNVRGYAYHPRFLTFRTGFEIELLQEFRDGDDRILPGGHWRLDVLPEHAYGGAFFGRIDRFQAEQRFTRTYPVDFQLYGATLYNRAGLLPFDLTIQHRSRKSEDVRQNADEIGDDLYFRGRYRQGRSEGKIEYDLTFEEVQGRDVRRQGFFASNFTYFDDLKRKRLRSILRFRENTSDIVSIYTISGLTDYSWKHTPTFSSYYSLDVQWNDANSETILNLNPRIGIRHQLYASLTSEFELYARLEDATSGRNDAYGVTLNESYNKRLGTWGSLTGGLGLRGELVQRRPEQLDALVINETQVLYHEMAVLLNRRGIFESTIVVTDETGGTIYRKGRDYQVIVRGDETEIRSRTTGIIADGERVLVQYRYLLTGEGDVQNTGITLLANLHFLEHYMIYGRWIRQDQTVVSGSVGQQLDSRDQQVLGLRLRWPWVSVQFEAENMERTLTGSYEAISESITITPLQATRWNVQLSASHRYQSYTDSGEKITQVTALARVGARLSRRLLFEITGDYRWERWRGGPSPGLNDLDDIGLEALLSWRYKAIRVELEGRYSLLTRVTQETDLRRVTLRVRRVF